MPPAVPPPGPVDPGVAGRLASWLAATIGGVADDATAIAAIESGTDGHVIDNLPGCLADCSSSTTPACSDIALTDGWPLLRATRPTRIAVVLPAPGGALPAVGSGPFARAALIDGSGVLLEGADVRLGLVPRHDPRGSSYRGIRWIAFVQSPNPAVGVLPATDVPLPDVPRVVDQSDRALRRAIRAATETLGDIDLARWRPELASGSDNAEALYRATRDRLPACWPPAARALVERALGLWWVLQVAVTVPGASSASATALRDDALRQLAQAVRESLMVAYNAPAQPLLGAPLDPQIHEVGRQGRRRAGRDRPIA
jgi:hypothetical protein